MSAPAQGFVRAFAFLLACSVLVNCSSEAGLKAGTAVPVSPEISSVTPTVAPLAGGGYAVLKGLGFKPGSTLTVGGAKADVVTVVDAQTITFQIPAGRPGAADLVLEGPVGGRAVFQQAITYVQPTAKAPALAKVTPNSGPARGGSVVLLEGTDFAPGAIVIVGGAPAEAVTVLSATQASARFPAHAPSGTVDVILTNADGQSAVLAGGFAYDGNLTAAPPKLTAVQPDEGAIEGGNRVTISAESVSAGAFLFIGGRPTAYETSPGGLIATMPAASRHGLVDVAITNADGQSAVLADAYEYVANHVGPPPAIGRVTPGRSVPEGGGRVLVEGDGFETGAQVLFGGRPATAVVVAGAHALSCVVPPGDAGSVDVTLQNPDGGLVTLHNGFSYAASSAAAPVVGSISPNGGPDSGGTVALVTGSGFAAGAVVFVGGRPATGVVVIDATSLSARTPALPTGVADVTVTNPDGRSGTLASAFAVSHLAGGIPPRVNGVTPAAGALEGGNAAIVTGEGFAPGARVFVGGRPAAAALSGGNAFTITVPAGSAAGLADVAVTNPDGESDVLPGGYDYYVAPPVLTGTSPDCGAAAGGTALVLSGRNFRPGVSATVGGLPLSGLVRVDANTLTGTTAAARAGTVDVVVTNPDGQADVLAGGFSFTDATHPCLSGSAGQFSLGRVVPSTGPTTGGAVIALFGAGFIPGTTVKFGDAAGTDVRLLGTGALTVRLPASAAVGPVDVVVTAPTGRTSRLASAFAYYDASSPLPPPMLASVSPNAGPHTGGSVVQLTGSNFVAGARVFFGATEATLPTLVDATRLVAVTPASLPGPVDVTVTNPDGRSATLSQGFAFYSAGAAGAPPLAQKVEPRTGSTLTATTTVLSGSGLQPGALVYFGDVPARSVRAEADGSLTCIVDPQSAGTVDVVVTNPDGQTSTIAQGFTFAPPAPHLAAVTPAFGPLAGGTTLVVSGSGFAAGDVILFGDAVAATKVLDDTAIFATVPAHEAGKVDVALQRNHVIADTLPAAFEFQADFHASTPPSIGALEPASGPVSGGTVLWLTGANLAEGAQVWFGPNAATKVVRSDASHAVVYVPPGVAGFVDVNVVNPDGQAGALLRGFSYVQDALLSGLAPRLSAVTPDKGPESTDTVDILTGRNFVAGELVFVGAARGAGVRLLSSSILDTTFPHQAAGTVDVAVTHPDGRSSVLPNAFSFLARPTIVSVANAAAGAAAGSSGPTKGGTPVTIAGSGFQAGATVTFGNVPATQVNVQSASVLTAVTPPGQAGLVDVKVIDPDGQTAIAPGAWLYVAPPAIAAVWPPSGPAAGGTIALVSGTNFDPRAVVSVNGAQVETVYGSAGSLAVTMPSGSGAADLVVTNPDGQTAKLAAAFTWTNGPFGAAPTLATVTPAAGPDTGGSFVRLAGTNFAPGAMAIVSGAPLGRNLVVSSSTITGLTPPGKPGPVRVAVTTPDGQSVRLDGGYTYVARDQLGIPPVIAKVAPTSAPAAPAGGTLTITGANFQSGALVFVQGRPAPTEGGIQQGGTTILASLPLAQPGAADVAVTNPDGQTADATELFSFTVPPPQFDGTSPVAPVTGPTAGGTAVVIKGAYFLPPVKVFFGQTAATVTAQNDHELDVVAPPGVNGAVQVLVVNSDGKSAALPGAFSYQAPPVVVSVSPTSGPPEGGIPVTIQGQFFRGSASTLVVKFGQAVATVGGTPTSTLIQVTAPSSSAAGGLAVAVTVTDEDGQTFTLPGGFVYLPPAQPPVVSGITPNAGQLTGGNTVTILGANFQAGATVGFGADSSSLVAASAVNVTSSGALTCVVPGAAQAGAVGVQVKNPDGRTGFLPGSYTYTSGPPPAALSLLFMSPAGGDKDGGTQTLIAGTGFQSGAAPKLVPHDGSSCPPPACDLLNVVVLGPTGMTATLPPQPLTSVANYDLRVAQGSSIALLPNAFQYGTGTRRWVPQGLRLPMESSNGKGGRGLSNGSRFTPGPTGTVGAFTRSEAGVRDVWLGGSNGRAPRLLQGQTEPVQTSARRFVDFTANQKNPDGSTMTDTRNGSPWSYKPFKPVAADVDGNGWQDVVFWNDDRRSFNIQWNNSGVLQTQEYSNPTGQDVNDWAGGFDFRGSPVDLNLDGAPDYVFAVDGRDYVMLGCGAGSAARCATNSPVTINVAVSAGTQTITTSQMSEWNSSDWRQYLVAGQTKLVIDQGPAQETVTVSAVTTTSFTATFTKAHASGTWVSYVHDVTSSTPVAAGSDTSVTVSSMEGFGLTGSVTLVADPGNPNEERVQPSAYPDYAKGQVRFHFAKSHAAGFRLTTKDAHYFAPDQSRFPPVPGGTPGDLTYTIVAGDLDGDGDPDVITGNDQEGIKVWLNNAADLKRQGLDPAGWSFTLSTTSTMPGLVTGGNVRALALFDANNDGSPDLLVGYNGGGQERLFINKGSGVFGDETTSASGGCAAGPNLPRLPVPLNDSVVRYELRDLDGANGLDVLAWIDVRNVANTFQKPLRYWINDGKGCFYGAGSANGSTMTDNLFPPDLGVAMTWSYALDDFNGDGLPDMIANFEGVQTREYVNTSGRFLDKTMANMPNAVSPSDSVHWYKHQLGSLLVDVNGDGFPDLVTFQSNLDPNTGQPGYGCGGGPSRYCNMGADGGIHVYLNDQAGNFPHDDTLTVFPTVTVGGKITSALPIASWSMDSAKLSPTGPQAILIGSDTDYSGNGLPSWLKGTAFEAGTGSARLLVNNGKGVFTDVTYPRLPAGRFAYLSVVKFVDLDGDGNMDVVTGDAQNGQLQVWQNSGNGYFVDVSGTALKPYPFGGCGGRVNQIVPANLDQDNLNRTDLLVLRDCDTRILVNKSDPVAHSILLVDESATWYCADGSVCNTTARLPVPSPGAVSAVVGDFDCVGGPDIYLLRTNGSEAVYTNTLCLQGGPCGFFNDVSATYLPPPSLGSQCVGTDCSGNMKAVGLSYDSSNTDLFIARYSNDGTVRPHRLLKNRCGKFDDISTALYGPIPSDNDKIYDVLVGDVFGHKDGNMDLLLMGQFAPRVYLNTP